MSRSKTWIWASLAASLFGFSSAQAQTYTWNNFNASQTPVWSTSTNWTAAPTFTQDTALVFGSSLQQIASGYTSTNDGINTVNSLQFNLDGQPVSGTAFNGVIVNAGSVSGNILGLSTSTTNVAPSIQLNGSGGVQIQQSGGFGSISIEGTQALQIGGNGIGMIKINAPIASNAISLSGLSNGINVNFDASAQRPYFSGSSVYLGTANTFLGNVTLTNGNLGLGNATALGNAANQLIINSPTGGGSNSIRFSGSPIIANSVVLNSTMNVVGIDGSTSTFTGSISGNGGINVNPSAGMTFNLQGTNSFSGPVVVGALRSGLAGTLNDVVLNLSANGQLATTSITLAPGSVMNLNNTATNLTRLAGGTTLNLQRSTVTLTGNSLSNSAETVANLNTIGQANLTITPNASTSSTLTVTNWNHNGVNSTGLFTATGMGSVPGANVGNIVITNNPGGSTSGTTTAGTQNLAVLPYAYGNTASTGNWTTSLVRWDSATGRITPLNYNTEYAGEANLVAGAGSGTNLNYRSASTAANGNVGGVPVMAGNVSGNGLVLDTNYTTAPVVGTSVTGTGTLTLSGPVLATFSGSAFPQSIAGTPGYLGSIISTGTLAFGANTAYFHVPGELSVTSDITGSAGLVKAGFTTSGTGSLTLVGPKSFTGGLTVNAGYVNFDADNNLGAAGQSITLNAAGGGGINYAPNQLFGPPPNTTSLTINRPLSLGQSGGTIAVQGINNRLVYSGQITGSGALLKQQFGTLELSNATNSFTGDVYIRTGVLIADSDGALGNAGNSILIGNNSSGLNVFQPGSGYSSTNRNFLIIDVNSGIFLNGQNFTINGAIVNPQAQTSNMANLGLTVGGLGNLTLTAQNTLNGAVTVGYSASGSTVGLASNPSAAQIGTSLTLSGPNGSLQQSTGIGVNNGSSLILDNTAAVNNDRVGTGTAISIGGGSLVLKGNSAADVTEIAGSTAFTQSSTLTLVQPAGGGSRTTTLNVLALLTQQTTSATVPGNLFVRGNNLGAASGDRTQLIVTPNPATLATSIPQANGILIGGVGANTDTAPAPTTFLTVNTIAGATPNVNRYSIGLLADASYGSLSSPGAAVTADQSGSSFSLTSSVSLNALRIGNGGGVDLNSNTLTMGGAAITSQTGMILSTNGPNAGITGPGTLAFGDQNARFIVVNDLTIGTAGTPVTMTHGTASVSHQLVKSGPGTLTLYGTSGTNLAASSAGVNGVNVDEGTLVLGNANALGVLTVAGAPNVMSATKIKKGATLDVSNLSTARFVSISGSGTVNLGNAQINQGNSSNDFAGNLVGSASSKWVVGIAQAEAAGNTFGVSNQTLYGDNSQFFGQFQVLRGALRFSSQLAMGAGTSPIIVGDTAGNSNAILTFDSSVTTVTRDILVQNNPSATTGQNTILSVGDANQNLNGNLTLNQKTFVGSNGDTSGANVHSAMVNFNGTISGAGQLQIGAAISNSVIGGSVGFYGNNTGWSGGVVLQNGGSSLTASSGVGSFVTAIGNNNALGTGAIVLGTLPGLLRADGGSITLANTINVAPGVSATTRATQFGFTGTNDITLAGGISATGFPTALSVATAVSLNLSAVQTGTATLSGAITNGDVLATLSIVKNGPGTVVLSSGASTFTGGVTVNAGTLGIGADSTGAVTSGPVGQGTLTVNGGALRAEGGNRAISNAVAAAGNFSVYGSNNLTLNGTMTGAGNITKIGSGGLLLNGASPGYTGGITVYDGSLGGSGSIAGSIATVGATAVLSPGNSPGQLTVDGNVNLGAGSTFKVELNGTTLGGTYDNLTVAGSAHTVTITNSILNPTTTNTLFSSSDKLFIMVLNDPASTLGTTFAGIAQDGPVFIPGVSGGTSQWAYVSYTGDVGSGALTGGNDIVLYNFSAVPEPTTIAFMGLLGAGAVGGWYYRRRRLAKQMEAKL